MIAASNPFRILFESSADAYFLFDETGTVDCNESALKLTGHSKEEVLSLHPAVFSPEYQPDGELSAAKRQRMDAMALEHGFHRFDWTALRADGTKFQVECTLTPLILDGLPFMLVIAHDVTEIRDAQSALAASQQLLQSILENSIDGIIVYEVIRDENAKISDFQFSLINPASERLLRQSASELLGKRLLELFPNVTKDGLFAKFVQIVETGETLEFEHYSPRTDPPRWYRLVGAKIGEGLSLSYQDITERKKSEAEISKLNHELEERVELRTRQLNESERTSDERFQLMANSISQLAWIAQADGFITWYNQRWYDYTGTTPEQMEGWGWQSVHDPQWLPRVMEQWTSAIASGQPFDMEFPLLGSDGVFRTYLTLVLPVRDQAGQVIQWFGTNTDIDELKRAENRILRANEALEQRVRERTAELHDKNIELQNAAETKNRFLANMSHELRTPLNGIIGFSELLVDGVPGEINEQQREFVQDILNSGNHLLQLINDVLDLAKVEAGKMELHPESFSLIKAVEQVSSMAYPMVQKKNIQVTTTLAPGVDEVFLDQQKFKQILYNLLSNATKFTPARGRIEITIARHDDHHFSLAVRDTGIGIRSDDIKKLFREFQQIDEGATRQFEGTGLGLALTRNIVQMQGGSIKVESEFGQGSTFTVTLPISLPEGT